MGWDGEDGEDKTSKRVILGWAEVKFEVLEFISFVIPRAWWVEIVVGGGVSRMH